MQATFQVLIFVFNIVDNLQVTNIGKINYQELMICLHKTWPSFLDNTVIQKGKWMGSFMWELDMFSSPNQFQPNLIIWLLNDFSFATNFNKIENLVQRLRSLVIHVLLSVSVQFHSQVTFFVWSGCPDPNVSLISFWRPRYVVGIVVVVVVVIVIAVVVAVIDFVLAVVLVVVVLVFVVVVVVVTANCFSSY